MKQTKGLRSPVFSITYKANAGKEKYQTNNSINYGCAGTVVTISIALHIIVGGVNNTTNA